MFIATRITNYLICVFASLLSVTYLLGHESSLGRDQAVWIAFQLNLVGSIGLFDLLFRRQNQKGDTWFSVVWTLMFAYASYVGLYMVFVNTSPEQFEKLDNFTIALCVFIVLPFLLNGIYLTRLLMKKRADAEAV